MSFHLSIRVRDLAETKRYFTEVLGCALTDDAGAWCNVDLFGHQLTVHQAGDDAPTGPGALDHFGVNLSRTDWTALHARLEAAGADFRLPPMETEGRGKFVLAGPDGIGLEFKYSEA